MWLSQAQGWKQVRSQFRLRDGSGLAQHPLSQPYRPQTRTVPTSEDPAPMQIYPISRGETVQPNKMRALTKGLKGRLPGGRRTLHIFFREDHFGEGRPKEPAMLWATRGSVLLPF